MTTKKSIQIQLLFLLAILTFTFYMASRMPDTVPIHWNAAGKVDGYGSKWTSLAFGPGSTLFTLALTLAIPALSPKKYEVATFEPTYSYIMVVVSLLMSTISVVITLGSAGYTFDMTRVMMAILFGFFALLGNVLGKTRPNYYMGVRTPWTLSSEKVWHATHRAAGRLWTFGGVIGLIASICGLPFWFGFTLFMLMAIHPVLNSYLLYRKIEN